MWRLSTTIDNWVDNYLGEFNKRHPATVMVCSREEVNVRAAKLELGIWELERLRCCTSWSKRGRERATSIDTRIGHFEAELAKMHEIQARFA